METSYSELLCLNLTKLLRTLIFEVIFKFFMFFKDKTLQIENISKTTIIL